MWAYFKIPRDIVVRIRKEGKSASCGYQKSDHWDLTPRLGRVSTWQHPPPPPLTTTWVKLVFSVYLKKDDSVGVFDDRAGVGGEEVLHFLVFQRLELRGGVGAGDHGRDLLTAVGPVVCKNQQTSQIHK